MPPSQLDNILTFTHRLWPRFLPTGGTALDATAGNGHDTLKLAQIVGSTGKVYAFDIQHTALQTTRQRLEQHHAHQQVQLIHAPHQHLADHVPHGIDLAVFNCGYLPHGDKTLTTQTETTLLALNASLQHLRRGGLLSLALYSGHPEGQRETHAVLQWAQALNAQQFCVLHYAFINRPNHPPLLLAIEKITDV